MNRNFYSVSKSPGQLQLGTPPGQLQLGTPSGQLQLGTPPGRQRRDRELRSNKRSSNGYQPNESLLSIPPVGVGDYQGEDDSANGMNGDNVYDGDVELPLLPNRSARGHDHLVSRRYVQQADLELIRLDISEITTVLQEQQAILRKILTQQETMTARQDKLDETLISVQEDMQSSREVCSLTGKQQHKSRVARDLTNRVALVHESLVEGFNPEESSLSNHNKAVKENIVSEIIKMPECKYSEEEVKMAVKRKYEGVRRQWLDEEKEEHKEIMSQRAKKKKYASRLQRKFDRRSVVLLESEKKYWKDLSVEFMSDESDDEKDPNAFIIHPLSWRSEKLVQFLGKLDERYEAKLKKDNVLMARKVRHLGEESCRCQPPNSPKWTVKQPAAVGEVLAELEVDDQPFTIQD